MLSSPPPLVRGVDERAGRRVEVARPLDERVRIAAVADHVVSPSEQSRKTSPGSRLDRERVDVDVGLGAERARDHRALRVGLGLLRRELAAAHQLGDERVVVGELLEHAVADAVRARVADVAERDRRRPSTSATVIVVPIPEVAASSLERW